VETIRPYVGWTTRFTLFYGKWNLRDSANVEAGRFPGHVAETERMGRVRPTDAAAVVWREDISERSNATPTPGRRCCQDSEADLHNLLNCNGLQTGDLGFEPSSHALHSHWGGTAMALLPQLLSHLMPPPNQASFAL
jgi:hypothetical protein